MPEQSPWQLRQWHMPHALNCLDGCPNGVQVWRVDLDCTESVRTELYTYLSLDERDRAARFRFDHHRHHFVVARGFLRLILAAYTGQSPASLEFSYGDRGKPFLVSPAVPPASHSPVYFNLSHAAGIALYAVSGDRPVGIDVESIRPVSSVTGLAQRFFFHEEYAVIQNLPPAQQEAVFFRGWTRKEAYLKATGDGLAGLEDIPATLLTPTSAHTHTQMSIGPNWWLTDISLDPGFLGALVIGLTVSNGRGDRPTNPQIAPPPLQFFHLIPT
ncbi:MAG: 4'-phosphopantetheinyl transferase superfamily protein [Leptolyngbyaceae bacterium]|nr:4'-phosphopantetheinyl transferase superfamily protein [Leptolyngbyaceae bacterium]